MQKYFLRVRKIVSGFTLYDWLAVVLVVIGAFLRLYNLEDSQQFLGDQGRDSMVVSRIFKERDLVFIGPVTSVGNMYLGPLYYYFMLPFLWLSYPSPMGPIYAVAILGTVTIGVLYWVGKKLLGERAALAATLMFTFSSAVVTYSRFSWNPNPAPLPSMLMIYFIYLAWKKNSVYWLAAATMFSLLLQLHYVALLAGGTIGVVWLISLIQKIRQKKPLKKMLLHTIGGAAIVLLFFLPLFLFDLKNNWLNFQAFQNLFIAEEAFEASRPPGMIAKVIDIARDFRSRATLVLLSTYFGSVKARTVALIAITTASVFWFIKNKKSKKLAPALILLIYIVITIFGLTFYNGNVYIHYISFIFPAVFLFFGLLSDYFIKLNKYLGWSIFSAVMLMFLTYNLKTMPFQDAGWKISDISRTADTIAERVEPGESYNIVLLSETQDLYGQNYRYFLTTKKGKEPINPERPVEISKLFIINEQKIAEDAVNLPIYEIQIFPNKQPVEIYQVEDGPDIYVLEAK